MARYICPRHGCTLSLKLSDPAVCPVLKHPLKLYSKPALMWVNATETGCLEDPHNAQQLKAEEERFYKTPFEMRNFVPQTRRGLFDVSLSPVARTATITVRLFCTFTKGMVPKSSPGELAKDYAELTDWTPEEQPKWMAQSIMAVADAWEGKAVLVLRKPGWKDLRITPRFRLDFVSSVDQAHVAPSVSKIPPVRPEFFNCGGTFVGLDQIIQSNPLQVSKAAFTSQSGIPVTMDAANLGLRREGTVNYNVMAHEYGHMIGLPDEYEDPKRASGATPAENAKAIHKEGTLALAKECRLAYAPFGLYTESIMSRGSTVLKCHFITVWQALTLMTKDFVQADDWEIE